MWTNVNLRYKVYYWSCLFIFQIKRVDFIQIPVTFNFLFLNIDKYNLHVWAISLFLSHLLPLATSEWPVQHQQETPLSYLNT